MPTSYGVLDSAGPKSNLVAPLGPRRADSSTWRPSHLPAVSEEPPSGGGEHSPGGTAEGAYVPFDSDAAANAEAAAVMEAAVAETVLLAAADAPAPHSVEADLLPLTAWTTVDSRCLPSSSSRRNRRAGGSRTISVLVALAADEASSSSTAKPELTAELLEQLSVALRADSPGAPSNYREAVAAGPVWVQSMDDEMGNHLGSETKTGNATWVSINRDDVPSGRRIHKLIWVFKLKREFL